MMEQPPDPDFSGELLGGARTFYPDKLVRDRIVELFRLSDYEVDDTQVEGVEFALRLHLKLDEELAELQQAPSREEALIEAADVRSVLITLQETAKYDEPHGWEQLASTCEAFDISMEEIIEMQQVKDEAKGGFSRGVVVRSFTVPEHIPDDDKWLAYFRSHPQQYPTEPRS